MLICSLHVLCDLCGCFSPAEKEFPVNVTTSIPQPIPYQGSKRGIAPQIIGFFPEKFSRFVEPFAGSAALSLAVASRGLANRFWLNDAHKPLMDLWKAIIETPEELATSYDFLWHDQLGDEKEYFNRVRERFNRSHEPADFLYLLARCVKASIRYNSRGEFNNTPDNRRKGARPEEMRTRLLHASCLFVRRTHLTATNYLDILDQCTPDDLVYMDPPYQGVCKNRDQRYCPPFDHATFCRAIEKLNSRGIQFIISYDGRTGDKVYGKPIPPSCRLTRFEIAAGLSSQATLLGRREETIESLYLSPNLVESMKPRPRKPAQQLLWQ